MPDLEFTLRPAARVSVSRLSDSNRGPTVYKTVALTTELRRQNQKIRSASADADSLDNFTLLEYFGAIQICLALRT